MHVLQRLGKLPKYKRAIKKGNRVRLHCKICHQNTAYYCIKCSDLKIDSIYACCNPNNDRGGKSYALHLKKNNDF